MLCKIDATDLECKLKYVYGLNYFLCPFCFCCIGCNICHLVLNLNGRIFIITRSICSFLVVVFCPPIYMMFVFCCVQIFVLCVLLCYCLPLGSSLPFSWEDRENLWITHFCVREHSISRIRDLTGVLEFRKKISLLSLKRKYMCV